MTLLAVLTTTPEEARLIARARLSPCARVERIDSLCLWQGEARKEAGWRLLVRTTANAFGEVERVIRRTHSCEEPVIVARPVVAGSPGTLAWAEEGARGRAGPRP